MTATEAQKMTGAQCLIKALEDVGVDTIFGYPGGQAIDIYNALYDSKKLHHILVRHEQGAAHAADGYARATGKVGTVIVTSGPGATNTVTGISTAYMDSIPLVVITGQVATSSLGSDAFQESDMTGITMPIVKHSYLVHDPEKLPEIIAEAYYIASTGRPGPVVIDVPGNISKAQNVPYHFPDEVKLESYKPTYKGNSKQIRSAARALEKAERPVIYAGGGILSSNASAELLDLAETLQIPVVVSLIGKSCMPEDNPLCLGMPGMHGSRAANAALQNSSLIFAVGTRFADRVTGRLSAFAPDAKVIHVDIDPAEIGKNRNADIPVVGDARLVLAAINEQLHKDQAQPIDAEWVAKIDGIRRESPFYYEKRDDAIQPEYALELLDKLTKDRDTVFTTEVGQHQMWAAQYLHCTRPRTFLSSGGAGTMGFGFPAAIGAQEGCPNSLVVCIAGDGSLQMNIQEMATAYEAGTPVKVLLLNNSTLGMVHQWQDLFYNKRYSQTVFTGNPDFVKLAEAYHWYGDSVSDPAQLEGAMEKWLSQEGPALLEVVIPDDENVFPMVPAGGTLTGQIGVVKLDESGHPVEKKGK